MKILFSIIIPLYNKKEYIKSTIESVLKQSYTNYEIIVVDDGSTDKSPDIVKSIKDSRILLVSKTNGGVSSARNYGINKSKGDFICFLDSDDLWTEDYLETLNKIITQKQDVDMICSAYGIFRVNPQSDIRVKRIKLKSQQKEAKIDFFFYCLKEKRCISFTSATCIKRKIINNHNLYFDEQISMGEDIDYWTRAASLANNIYYNDQIQVLYRTESNNSLSAQGKSMEKSYPYWKWYDSPYMQTPMQKKFTTRMIYTLCRDGYKRKEYLKVIKTITKTRGTYLIISRIGLFVLSFIKKYGSSN